MNTVVAVVLAKERRMVARFVAAGALSRERAQSLQQLGLNRGVILHRLRQRAVVRQAAPDLYYVDEESWNAVRRMRRRAASVIAAVALAIIFAIVFGARRARAEQHSSFSREVDSVFAQWDPDDCPEKGLNRVRDIRFVKS